MPVGFVLRAITTDRDGNPDAGAIALLVVVAFMCVSSGYDTFYLAHAFNAQDFGVGMAACIGAFGGYKWGDSRDRRPQDYGSKPRRVDIPNDR